jgi:hypothetical protein
MTNTTFPTDAMAMTLDGVRQQFQEQIDFFKAKLNLPTKRWDDLWQGAHDRAFMVAGAQKADLLNDLRLAVEKSISGQSIGQFRKDFAAAVAKSGWTGWTGEGSTAGMAWRTRIIYQTNLASSYAAGRWKQLHDPALLSVRPFWRYIHNDSVMSPRPQHAAWGASGLTLPYDHPFWQTHFPPNGWGCRCSVHPVRMPAKGDASTAPEGWDTIDPKTGAPPGVDKGWAYAPGASVGRSMQQLIDDKLINLDAPIGAAMAQALQPVLAMERQLAWWETLDQWLKTPQSGRSTVVGSIDSGALAWLEMEKGITPKNAAIGIQEGLIRGTKQARHIRNQDGLLAEDWRRLTSIMLDPEAVYFDTRTGKMVYVASAGDAAGVKLSVEFDYRFAKTERMNMVVSGFRQASKKIDELVRGGLYVPVQ